MEVIIKKLEKKLEDKTVELEKVYNSKFGDKYTVV